MVQVLVDVLLKGEWGKAKEAIKRLSKNSCLKLRDERDNSLLGIAVAYGAPLELIQMIDQKTEGRLINLRPHATHLTPFEAACCYAGCVSDPGPEHNNNFRHVFPKIEIVKYFLEEQHGKVDFKVPSNISFKKTAVDEILVIERTRSAGYTQVLELLKAHIAETGIERRVPSCAILKQHKRLPSYPNNRKLNTAQLMEIDEHDKENVTGRERERKRWPVLEGTRGRD